MSPGRLNKAAFDFEALTYRRGSKPRPFKTRSQADFFLSLLQEAGA